MATFGAKLEHLLSSRAEMISRMHRPPPAEGNDIERLLNLPPNQTAASQAPLPNNPVWPDEVAAAFCAIAPPIETFMDVPDEIRREQFFATCRREDIVVGSISVIQDSGLLINILAYDQGPRRDLGGLRIMGFCPLRQLPRYNNHGNALDAFQEEDKVRAFIIDVHGQGRPILSMNPKLLNRELYGDLKLGLIKDDELPLHYRKLQNLDNKSYEAYLELTPQFRNPDGLQVLCARMGIPRSSACSLLMTFGSIRLPKSEMACELRRTQLLNFSMKHVAQGVKCFKEGKNTEALQCYNFAIEVEPTNPDAYVARGALHASVGTYVKAIDDLEKSLDIQPNHINAKNYLGQTLVAYASEIRRKEPAKAEQLLNRAIKLDLDNFEARDALKELQSSGLISDNKNIGLRAWSRSPSPRNAVSHNASFTREDQLVVSPSMASRQGGTYVSHMERSRAALEQLVEEDRNKRAGKDVSVGRSNRDFDQSPSGFYSPNRFQDRRRNDFLRVDMKATVRNADKSGIDRDDLAKIVITRNRSGRIIRCKADDDDEDEMGDEFARNDGHWKRPYDESSFGDRRFRGENDDDLRNNRRIYTPPRTARSGEHGSHTVYKNENDLPMTSKTLQERIQARLRAIERRHQQGDGNPADVDMNLGPSLLIEKNRENTTAGDETSHAELPKDGWRGKDNSFERRQSGGFQRPDFYGNRGAYFGRGRGRGGGHRWRPQWDDFRGRRNNWHNHRYDDRRRDSGGFGRSSVDRRRKRKRTSGSTDRSARSSRSRSRTRSRSRSYSRSPRSYSPSPARPGARGRVISRARIKTPPLAPLVTNIKRSESEENLAELDQIVAQLKAKREMEQQFEQQHGMPQYQEMAVYTEMPNYAHAPDSSLNQLYESKPDTMLYLANELAGGEEAPSPPSMVQSPIDEGVIQQDATAAEMSV